MLTLARALGRSPKILLADELSLGLAPLVVERLLAAVRAAADSQGVACLFVEQHVRQALEIADRVYVLKRGRIVMSGTSEEITRDIEMVERAYLTGVVDSASDQQESLSSRSTSPAPPGPADPVRATRSTAPGGDHCASVDYLSRYSSSRTRVEGRRPASVPFHCSDQSANLMRPASRSIVPR